MSASVTETGSCDYCGLPIVGSAGREADDEPAYCCFGCRLAASVTGQSGPAGQVHGTLIRLGLSIFFTLQVIVFTMALWSSDLFPTEASPLQQSLSDLYRWLGLLASLPPLFLLGKPLLENAWQQKWRGSGPVDALLVSGVVAAYGFSAVSVYRGGGPVYFEVGCLILIFVTLGRWLEARGKFQASQALTSLERLLPHDVQRLAADGSVETLPRMQLQPGDCLLVATGQRVPVDGVIQSEWGEVDEQILTGESWPVEKRAGDRVLAGSLNAGGEMVVRLDAPVTDSVLERMVQALQAARLHPGRAQRLAERVARWFMPLMLLVAVVVTVTHGLSSGWDQGLLTGLSVVLIACPCSLGLATPLAVWSALGIAARQGTIIRQADSLERLSRVRAIRWDKTGTLTTGSPTVRAVHCAAGTSRADIWSVTQSLTRGIPHIFSQALQRAAGRQAGLSSAMNVTQVEQIAGRGITGRLTSTPTPVWLGSLDYLRQFNLQLAPELERVASEAIRLGQPLCVLGWDGHVRALFVFAEEVRPEVDEVLDWLRQRHYDVAVLTGDHRGRGAVLERQLGITFQAELLPEQKVAAIHEAQARIGPTAMIGDGINDSWALSQADVGIALGCGADVTRETADVCLLGSDLRQIPALLELSHSTAAVIRQNLVWAFGYNLAGVGLAAAGRLNPVIAALVMTVSSFLVIGNSLRLRWKFDGHDSADNRVREPGDHGVTVRQSEGHFFTTEFTEVTEASLGGTL